MYKNFNLVLTTVLIAFFCDMVSMEKANQMAVSKHAPIDAHVRSITNNSSMPIKVIYRSLMTKEKEIQIQANANLGKSQLYNFGVCTNFAFLSIVTQAGTFRIDSIRLSQQTGLFKALKLTKLEAEKRIELETMLMMPYSPELIDFEIVIAESGQVSITKECPICLEDNTQNIIAQCGHQICNDCMLKKNVTSCPECRLEYPEMALKFFNYLIQKPNNNQ